MLLMDWLYYAYCWIIWLLNAIKKPKQFKIGVWKTNVKANFQLHSRKLYRNATDFSGCCLKTLFYVKVFLISTRAGGLGLNLVSANRVVIFDPSWNPSHDLQAQDRSFRFGQKRHVMVFRLLAAGSLEELVYTRQVYKQQLSNIAVSGKMENRYFEGVQDCKEFQGELFGICNLFRDLSDKLFTSEIIELHENQGEGEEEEDGYQHSDKHDLDDLKMCFLPMFEAANEPKGTIVKSKNVASSSHSKPILADMGIVYAHRNEDIINSRPGNRKVGIVGKGLENMENPVLGRRKPDTLGDIVDTFSSKSRKRYQFTLIAQSVEMNEVEFSRWILSATPAERENVLYEYKKRKEKMPVEY